jgi:hypothetical protein
MVLLGVQVFLTIGAIADNRCNAIVAFVIARAIATVRGFNKFAVHFHKNNLSPITDG